MQQRLQKTIADAGLTSRRKAEEWIAAGRVAVDDAIITMPGTLVDPLIQKITVDGQPLPKAERHYYVALNKPAGYVSTVADRHAEKKVTDLVKIPGARLVPAGRLDAETEGLILLSNDGDFIYAVTHPSKTLGKLYNAVVKGRPDAETLKRLSKGLMLEGESRPTASASVRLLRTGDEPGTSLIALTLHEGRKRQVRRMLETVGHPVIYLRRVQVGPVGIGNLARGEWRELTPREIAEIRDGKDTFAATPETQAEKEKRRPASNRGDKSINHPGNRGSDSPGKRPSRPSETRFGNAYEGRKPSQESDRRNFRGEDKNETGHRGGSRPRPGQDNRKPVEGRFQVHQNRVDGRVPPRRQRDVTDGGGGQRPRPMPRNNRGSKQNP
jgi:pseudouridine synthase